MMIFRFAFFLCACTWAVIPGQVVAALAILPDYALPNSPTAQQPNSPSNIPPDDCIDSVHISVKPVQCYGLRNGEIRIDAVFGGTAPFYYSLDGVSYSTRPEFDHLWPGAYEVWIRDELGCERRQKVIIHEPEEVTVQLIATDTLIPSGAVVEINAIVLPAETKISDISWRPPDLFPLQDTLRQSVSLKEKTDVAIEVRTDHQCVARDQVHIEVERNSVFIPNVIKPGSNQNAYFTIFADEALHLVLSLQVYNRNGSLVFERNRFEPNDPLKGWNGKWGDRYAQPGVYAWTALLQYADGSEEWRTGTVTVVR